MKKTIVGVNYMMYGSYFIILGLFVLFEEENLIRFIGYDELMKEKIQGVSIVNVIYGTSGEHNILPTILYEDIPIHRYIGNGIDGIDNKGQQVGDVNNYINETLKQVTQETLNTNNLYLYSDIFQSSARVLNDCKISNYTPLGSILERFGVKSPAQTMSSTTDDISQILNSYTNLDVEEVPTMDDFERVQMGDSEALDYSTEQPRTTSLGFNDQQSQTSGNYQRYYRPKATQELINKYIKPLTPRPTKEINSFKTQTFNQQPQPQPQPQQQPRMSLQKQQPQPQPQQQPQQANMATAKAMPTAVSVEKLTITFKNIYTKLWSSSGMSETNQARRDIARLTVSSMLMTYLQGIYFNSNATDVTRVYPSTLKNIYDHFATYAMNLGLMSKVYIQIKENNKLFIEQNGYSAFMQAISELKDSANLLALNRNSATQQFSMLVDKLVADSNVNDVYSLTVNLKYLARASKSLSQVSQVFAVGDLNTLNNLCKCASDYQSKTRLNTACYEYLTKANQGLWSMNYYSAWTNIIGFLNNLS